MLSRGIAAVGMLITVSALAACAGNDESSSSSSSEGTTTQAKAAIKIGTSNPITGPVAASCKPYSDGASAWFDHVNADGGANGHKIESTVLDDGYDATQAVANARQFVQEDYFAVFGGCGALQPPAVEPIYKKADMPYLFPWAGVPGLDKEDNVFTVMPLYGEQIAGIIEFAFKEHGPGSTVAILQQVPGVEDTEARAKAAVAKAGGTWSATYRTQAGTNDFTPTILKVKEKSPDYVILISAGADMARQVKTMTAQNAMPKKFLLSSLSGSTEAFVGPVGDLADGKILSTSPTVAPEDAKAEECRQVLEAASPPIKVDVSSLWGCGVAQLFVAAVEEMGDEVSRERLKEVIEGWSGKTISPVLPTLTFSPTNHQGGLAMLVTTLQDGGLQTVGSLEAGGN